jgi:hypothetical protein
MFDYHRQTRQAMSTQSTALDTHPALPQGHAVHQIPLLIKLVALTALVLTGIVLIVIITTRIQPLRQVVPPPPEYLPGSSFPDDVNCTLPNNGFHRRCFASFGDDEIYFDLEDDAPTISRTSVIVPYTLGELVSSWGTPAGITWEGMVLYIYWENRRALLFMYGDSLRPDSRIEFIVYDPVQQPEAPWRGFRRRNP